MQMFGLQRALRDAIRQLPAMALEQVIANKLKAAGVSAPSGLSHQIAKHVLSGSEEPFTWNGDRTDREVRVDVSDDDLAVLEKAVWSFAKEDTLHKLAEDIAQSLLKALGAQWDQRRLSDHAEMAGFRDRLEERWGNALDLLRMLLVICQEIGGEVAGRFRRSKSKKDRAKRAVLLRLHARSCQVVGEIVALIEAGFADGAMSRWRTLHELVVIANLASAHDDDLSERYVEHLAVESKRSLDQYESCAPLLGFRPFPKREAARIERRFKQVLKKYGAEFGSPYGWAAHHVNIKKPNFAQLEAAAGREAMRSHYKMASQNVHGGPHGIFFRLGLLDQGGELLLAGPSNAGFFDPGHLAARALVQITVLLFAGRAMLDELVMMKMLIAIDDAVTDAFALAERQLDRDERDVQKVSRR